MGINLPIAKAPKRNKKLSFHSGIVAEKSINDKESVEKSKIIEMLISENRELKTRKKEMESIFHSGYDGISIIDNDGTIIGLNKAFERLTGLIIEEYQGRNLYDIVKEGNIIKAAAALKVLETGMSATILQRYYTGKELMVTGNPVFDENGQIIRIVVNLRDVTELRKLQEDLRQTQELNAQYLSELQKLKEKHIRENQLIYKSPSMKNIFDLAFKIVAIEAPVLLLGESGTGKEVIASLLHKQNPVRSKQSFIKVNCGAIPRELMESEFFGYEPGAFTGAGSKGKPGFFELAHNGIIFLDEIAELPMGLQVKLLRVLQEQEFTRLGGTRSIKVNFRLISATNKDLEAMVKQGSFREDLFYRINVIPIKIPPLRERREDITALLFHYLGVFNKKYGFKKNISGDVVDSLNNYSWPGNVRELINLVERLVVTTESQKILVEDLPIRYQTEKISKLQKLEQVKLSEALDELEKCFVTQALETHKSTYKAARALGVSQSTIVRLSHKYGLKQNNV